MNNNTDVRALQQELRELRSECEALRAQLDGNIPKATHWLQSKVWRQRLALDAANRRIASQRFVLRLAEQLGHVPSRDEYVAARDAITNEQLKDRIEAEPATAAA